MERTFQTCRAVSQQKWQRLSVSQIGRDTSVTSNKISHTDRKKGHKLHPFSQSRALDPFHLYFQRGSLTLPVAWVLQTGHSSAVPHSPVEWVRWSFQVLLFKLMNSAANLRGFYHLIVPACQWLKNRLHGRLLALWRSVCQSLSPQGPARP